MKTKRAIKNMTAGIAKNIITIVLGIVIPKLLITNYGSEINGLVGSLTNVFVYLNLLESGVGAASRQAMYKHIVKNERNKINGIIAATNAYYKKIGVLFLACTSILAFAYPVLVENNIKYSTVVFLVFLTSSTFLINFFFQGKYTVLLNADNRGYVLKWFDTVTIFTIDVAKIILILRGYDIVLVHVSATFITLAKIFIQYHLYIKKRYDYINLNVAPDFDAISQKNSVLVIQIKSVVFNNIDILLLTLFTDLKVVSVYYVYRMVFRNISLIPQTIYLGTTVGFGHLYIEDKNRFYKLFDFIEAYYMPMVFALNITAYILIIPFLKLYTEGVTDVNYIDGYLPLLFLFVELFTSIRYLPDRVIYMVGHFKQTQKAATIETVINLIASVILVINLGIYGVLIGTVVALLYRSVELTKYTSKNILNRSMRVPWIRWARNSILSVLIISFVNNTLSLNDIIQDYFDFFLWGGILTICISIVFFIITTIFESKARLVLLGYYKRFLLKLEKKR